MLLVAANKLAKTSNDEKAAMQLRTVSRFS